MAYFLQVACPNACVNAALKCTPYPTMKGDSGGEPLETPSLAGETDSTSVAVDLKERNSLVYKLAYSALVSSKHQLAESHIVVMDAREEINLRVLQQHDSSIKSLIKQSPYVVLYNYSIENSSWSKLPYEGSLFIYSTSNGSCGYRILNRLSLDCFSNELHVEEDVMETEGYVIHKCGEDIWGIWIWDSADRSNIYQAMRKAARVSESIRSPNHDQGATSSLSPPPRTHTWTPSTIVGS